jgi:hypothetical protein
MQSQEDPTAIERFIGGLAVDLFDISTLGIGAYGALIRVTAGGPLHPFRAAGRCSTAPFLLA